MIAVAALFVFAQAVDPATTSMREGFTLVEKNQPAAAIARLEECVTLAINLKLPSIEAQCYRGLGRAAQAQRNYAQAGLYFVQAHDRFTAAGDHPGLGQNFNDRGFLAFVEGKAAEIRSHYSSAVHEFGLAGLKTEQAAALRSLTFSPGMPFEEKDRLLADALTLAVEAKSARIEALVLHHWGDMVFGQGDYARSFEYTQRAASLLENIGDSVSLARALTSLGRLYRAQGQPQEAVAIYERVLAVQQLNGDVLGEAQTQTAIGTALATSGAYREAVEHHARALDMVEKNGGGRLQVNFQRATYAMALGNAGEFARAAELMQQVIDAVPDSDDLASYYGGLSYSLLKLRRYAEAEAAASAGVEIATKTGHLEWRVDNLIYRSNVFEESGRAEAALADLQDASATIEQLRQKLSPADVFKSGFSERHQSLFSRTVEFLHAQGRVAEAAVVAEQARARAFLDLLASRAPEHAGPAPVPTEATLRTAAKREGSTLVSFWVGADEGLVFVVSPDGKFTSQRIPATRRRLTQLVRATWQLGGAAVSATRGDAALAQLTTRGGASMKSNGSETAAYRELYDLLIRPIRSTLPARDGLVTIVPHGPLFELSFGALSDASGRYLLEDFRLHYAPSAASLEFTERTKAAGRGQGYLLVANPAIAPKLSSSPLPPLPGAEREVREVSRVVGQTTTLVGKSATEDAIRGSIGKYRVVHFATHGIVSSNQPFDSFLAVAPDAGDKPSDGRLTAAEIYDLNLSADLVVLSACRAAGGQISGDGIIGLTRAFFTAGTPSILAALWDLPDESAERLLPRFYAEWRKTPDKSRALRAAQLSMLRDLRAGRVKVKTPVGELALPPHPVLWANLVLIGEP